MNRIKIYLFYYEYIFIVERYLLIRLYNNTFEEIAFYQNERGSRSHSFP